MIVQTKQGRVQGVKDGSVIVYRGIPYAEPPVGPLRYCRPRPEKAWEGTYIAQEFGAKALQPTDPHLQNDTAIYSEDCLTLNIWTPSIDNKKRKVIFWIHGGGFIGGSGATPKTPGRIFAEKDDLVFVSVNYRLGAFGFLYLGDLLGEPYASSGNCGLLDVIAALHWVQENISSFGGDPDCVTIMGQSAGAKTVAALLVTPEAKGMFHRAILQSGSIQAIRDKQTAQAITTELLEELGLRQEEAYKLLELSAEEILKAEEKLCKSFRGVYIFGPVIDGLIIPHSPEQIIEAGEMNHVPVLIGTNKEEAKTFGFANPGPSDLKEEISDTLFGKNGLVVHQAYCTACKDNPEREAWQDTLTEYLYRMASERLAALLADKGIPVWLYRFEFQGSTGAIHGAEMTFVWNDSSIESIPPCGDDLADIIHNAWVSFIHTGCPQTAELQIWTPYTAKERNTLIFDGNSRLESLPDLRENPHFPIQMIVL